MYEIKLRIHSEDELYSPYDETRRTLNSDVADYLSEQYSKKEIRDEILLKVKCDTPVSYERVRDAFRELIQEKETQAANQKRLNRLKQIWLFAIGVVFVAAAILLEGVVRAIPVELMSIVGSFAVWEATNIWIVENPRARITKRTIRKLRDTKILIDAPERPPQNA